MRDDSRHRQRERGKVRAPILALLLVVSTLAVTLWAVADEMRSMPSPPAVSTDAPSVLLVTIDTLRADHLGAYGYRRARTPTLDALAREGVRFADVSTASRFTGPSHATILTGLAPRHHGVIRNARRLSSGVDTLADLFGRAGFATAAFVSGWTATDEASGLPSRFGSYDDMRSRRGELATWSDRLGPLLPDPGPRPRRPAAEVTEAALGWLAHRGEGPFFAWVHYFDAHLPYEVPEECRSAATRSYKGPVTGRWYRLRPEEQARIVSDPAARAQMLRLYDDAIACVDRQLARLLEAAGRAAGRRGLRIAVAADHGESMGEHGLYWERDLYQPTLRVPLLLAGGAFAGGRVLAETVSLTDLAPTLLEAAGLPLPSGLDGHSLLPLAVGSAPFAQAPRPVARLAAEGRQQPAVAVRQGRWKLIERAEGWDGPRWSEARVELYDLQRDPEERNDLSRRPGHHGRIVQLESAAGDPRAEPLGRPRSAPAGATREMLKTLGYLE